MKKAFTVSIFMLMTLLAIVGITAQVTPPPDPDVDVTLTNTVPDPEVRAVPLSIELYGLNTATGQTARLCYQYYRQSGAASRIECRAVTNGGDFTTTAVDSLNALTGFIAPRTSTAQPAYPPKRLTTRIKAWTDNAGGPPNAQAFNAPRRTGTR